MTAKETKSLQSILRVIKDVADERGQIVIVKNAESALRILNQGSKKMIPPK